MKRIVSLIFCLIAVSTEVPSKQMDIEHYHQHSSIQWCWAQSSLYRIEIEGNETILDLGCGDGKISAYLARLVPDGSVVGLDPLQHAIEFASDRYGVSNLTFAQGDAALYSSPEGYDLITAFCTFNWIDDKEGAFARLAENLKPGGKALIVVPADFDSTEQLYKEWVLQTGLTICDWSLYCPY